MSDDRKPLPETGFRCYPAKPESITCNMVVNVDEMISWLQAEKASGENVKKSKQGKDTIYLTMIKTTRQDAKTSHFFVYDNDWEPSQNQGGHQQNRNNVTPMAPAVGLDDIPF